METNNKLRKALAEILGVADHVQIRFEIPKLANQEISELKQIAEAALAEPVKNCEVGTAEEQYERYKRRCKAQDCRDCPVRGNFKRIGSESCQLVWAQMPYEEGGAK